MKKLWILLFVLLVAVAGFVGAQKKATIVFYTPSWGDSFIKEIAARYAAERPNVQIDIIPGPSIWEEHVTKSQLWMNTKYKGVDIEYQDDVFAQDGAALGVWEDLWPFMSQAQKEDLTDVQLAYKKLFGGMYRVPWWQGMSHTFYNKRSSRGRTVRTRHWAQLSSTAAKLTMIWTAMPDRPVRLLAAGARPPSLASGVPVPGRRGGVEAGPGRKSRSQGQAGTRLHDRAVPEVRPQGPAGHPLRPGPGLPE
jgi:hypothetical protein